MTTALPRFYVICLHEFGHREIYQKVGHVQDYAQFTKKGDASSIANYRPIMLTEVFRKIIERCILQHRLLPLARLHKYQGGFREKRGTIDTIASLHESILQRKKRLGHFPLLAFLDIKSAYDTVLRPLLWSKLCTAGASTKLMAVLKGLFDFNKSEVVVNGRTSAKIHHEVGLLQGSILSPLLYSIFINDLASDLEICSRGKLGDVGIATFFYADDIALIADNVEHMHQLLSICEKHSFKHGYRFAPQKCEVIDGLEGDGRATPFRIDNENIPRSSSFVYLGMSVGMSGILADEHVKRMVSKFDQAVNYFRLVGFNGVGLSGLAKKNILCNFLRPMLEYGL